MYVQAATRSGAAEHASAANSAGVTFGVVQRRLVGGGEQHRQCGLVVRHALEDELAVDGVALACPAREADDFVPAREHPRQVGEQLAEGGVGADPTDAAEQQGAIIRQALQPAIAFVLVLRQREQGVGVAGGEQRFLALELRDELAELDGLGLDQQGEPLLIGGCRRSRRAVHRGSRVSADRPASRGRC